MTRQEKEYFIWLTDTADKYRGLFINRMFTDIVNNFLSPDFDRYKHVLAKLDNLRSKRNEFAHSKIDSRPESITANFLVRDKVHLVKLKNFKLKQVVLEIDILERQFDEYGQLIEDLTNLLKGYIDSQQALPS
jgi:hypothetical protein